MGKYLVILALVIGVGTFSSCGEDGPIVPVVPDACQEALDILNACFIGGLSSPFLEDEISADDCTGNAECLSSCVVVHPEGACDFQNHVKGTQELHDFKHCKFGCFVIDFI